MKYNNDKGNPTFSEFVLVQEVEKVRSLSLRTQISKEKRKELFPFYNDTCCREVDYTKLNIEHYDKGEHARNIILQNFNRKFSQFTFNELLDAAELEEPVRRWKLLNIIVRAFYAYQNNYENKKKRVLAVTKSSIQNELTFLGLLSEYMFNHYIGTEWLYRNRNKDNETISEYIVALIAWMPHKFVRNNFYKACISIFQDRVDDIFERVYCRLAECRDYFTLEEINEIVTKFELHHEIRQNYVNKIVSEFLYLTIYNELQKPDKIQLSYYNTFIYKDIDNQNIIRLIENTVRVIKWILSVESLPSLQDNEKIDCRFQEIVKTTFGKCRARMKNYFTESKLSCLDEFIQNIDSCFADFQTEKSSISSESITIVSEGIADNTEPELIINDVDFVNVKKESSGRRRKVKIDHIQQNIKKAEVGSKGEELVVKAERKRLMDLKMSDIFVDNIKRVSLESDSYGYDIRSYNEDGTERYIEVKSTNGNPQTYSFYISANELATARLLGERYYIYIVFRTNTQSPDIYCIGNPFQDQEKVDLIPMNYQVNIKLI